MASGSSSGPVENGRVFDAHWLLAASQGALAGAVPSFMSSAAQGRTIVQIELSEIIHPVSADYVAAGLARAEEVGAAAVIIRLDTPGGLVDSMRAIVEDILASDVPVIVWVAPRWCACRIGRFLHPAFRRPGFDGIGYQYRCGASGFIFWRRD